MTEWYVAQRGAVRGPMSTDEVIALIARGDVAIGDSVAAAGSGAWVPVEAAQPFVGLLKPARPVAATKRRSDGLVVALGLLGLLAFAGVARGIIQLLPASNAEEGTVARDRKQAEADQEKRQADSRAFAEITKPRFRSLRIKDSPHANLPVFPLESGLDDWLSASSSGSDAAALVSLERNGAFVVRPGTACQVVDAGLSVTQVRLLNGDHVGEKGFVPTSWID